MRILFISNKFYPDIGGIEVNSEVLAKEFMLSGHTIHLVTWTTYNGKESFPFQVIRNPSILQLLKEHLWAEIVYENNPSLRLSWPALFFLKPSVVALRTWVSRMDGSLVFRDRLKILLLKRYKAVIAVSKAVRDTCWPKAVVIGNPYRNQLFRILPKKQRNKTFVFLGRLVSDKGADFTVRALHRLISENKSAINFTLTIVGDGPDKPILESMVEDFNLENNVSFTGILQGEELVACLNAHKYILIPSLWAEPFGNVALEGMACGCIPIVSDGGGLTDAVGHAGIVFERGNFESFISSLEKILNDTLLQETLLNNAVEHLKDHQPDVVAKKYLKVIES